MDILLIVLGAVCMLLGLLGCVLPALPGPPVSYVGLLLLHCTDRIQFSLTEMLVLLLLVIVAQVLDYFIPILGSKYRRYPMGQLGCLCGLGCRTLLPAGRVVPRTFSGGCGGRTAGSGRPGEGAEVGYRGTGRFPAGNRSETFPVHVFCDTVVPGGMLTCRNRKLSFL